MKVKVFVAPLCSTLCNPMDCSPPGSSIHVIFHVRILVWVAISFSRDSSQHRDQTQVSCIAGGFLPAKPKGNKFEGFKIWGPGHLWWSNG